VHPLVSVITPPSVSATQIRRRSGIRLSPLNAYPGSPNSMGFPITHSPIHTMGHQHRNCYAKSLSETHWRRDKVLVIVHSLFAPRTQQTPLRPTMNRDNSRFENKSCAGFAPEQILGSTNAREPANSLFFILASRSFDDRRPFKSLTSGLSSPAQTLCPL
jgi:hypothetical protein